MSAQRLGIYIYPVGIAYADREVEIAGDYKRLGFLRYDTLEVEIAHSCPAELRAQIEAHVVTMQARRGEIFAVSSSATPGVLDGQGVLLGGIDGVMEPFCACGRRWSDCDGSRKACHKRGSR